MVFFGIVASPRKGKNTDLLVKEALIGASELGAKTKKIYIYDLNIKPCLSCDQIPEKYCLIKDDMETIYNILETADAIIIGTPDYYGSVPGPLKVIIDRCNCLIDIKSQRKKITKKKLGLMIITADRSKRFSGITRLIKFWGNDVNLRIIDRIIATKTTSQPVQERPLLLELAREKGRKLAKLLDHI